MGLFGGRKGRSRFVENENGVYKVISKRNIGYGGTSQRDKRASHMSVSGAASSKFGGGDSRPLDSRLNRYYDDDGRFRHHMNYTPLYVISKNGLRRDAACVLIALTAVVVLAVVLFSGSWVTTQEKKLASLRNSVERSVQKNEVLRSRCEEAEAGLNIAYNAKTLGLVSSKSLPVTRLYAPLDAQISPVEREMVLPSDTLATVFGN